MTISFSQHQLIEIMNAVGLSTESLKEVKSHLAEFKDQFNKTGVTLVQDQWDKEVNGSYLKVMNDEVVQLIEEIDSDFQELSKRQELLSGELMQFAQSNLENEEDAIEAAQSVEEG